MLDILNAYPIVKDEFLTWMALHYKVTEYDYASAEDRQQALALISWLGYKQEVPKGQKNTEKYLHSILGVYQDLAIKYSGDKDDFLKQINRMDFADREKKHPELFTREGEPSYVITLKDSMTKRIIPEAELNERNDSEFWNKMQQDPNQVPF